MNQTYGNYPLLYLSTPVSVQSKNLNGSNQYLSGNQSCQLANRERGQFSVKIKEEEFLFYCSFIEIAGLESVYTVAFSAKGMGSDVLKHTKQAHVWLDLLFAIEVVSLFAFIFILIKAAKREMFLCAALIKQMESTHRYLLYANHSARDLCRIVHCRIKHEALVWFIARLRVEQFICPNMMKIMEVVNQRQ